MVEEQVAPVSEEVEPAEVQEEEEPETPEEEESEASTEDEDGTEESEDSDDEEEQSDEDEEEGDEDEPSGQKKRSAQDRIQELANARREAEERATQLETRLKEIEEKFQQTLDNRQTVDVDALNNHLGKLRDQIEDLRLDGRHLEADMKEVERDKLITEYQSWQEADKEREKKLQRQQAESQYRQKSLQEFDQACAFLAKENNIPDDTFQNMGQIFQDVVKTDKVFAKRLMETIEYRGPVEAALMAHERVEKEIKSKEGKVKAEKEKKEKAKKSSVTSSGGKVEKTKDPDKMDVDEWMKWREKQLSNQ